LEAGTKRPLRTPLTGISTTRFCNNSNGAETRHNGAFVQDAITFASVIDDNQPTLWQDRVRLDLNFWRSPQDHPVPVREQAIQAIGTRNLAIDVYIWLAYRTKPHFRVTCPGA
jgi:Plasmid encoded RepA protein